MEDLLHIRFEDGSDEWVSPAKAGEFAKDMREAGTPFEVVRDVRTKGGEVVQRREDEADEEGEERVWPMRDGASTYTLDTDEQIEVADGRRDEFMADMEAEGRSILSVKPNVRYATTRERDEALSGGRDWGYIASGAIEGPKFVGRLAANLAEGAVAIPTMLSMAGDELMAPMKERIARQEKITYDPDTQRYVFTEDPEAKGKQEPSGLTQAGLSAVEAIEDFKHRHLNPKLATGSDDWRSLEGVVHNVTSGVTSALDFVGELAAAGAVGEVAQAAKAGKMAQAVPFSKQAAAARTAEAAAKAAAEGTTANAIEKRAAAKALEAVGGTVDVASREQSVAFAKAYARALPVEQFKAGLSAFADGMARPTYFKAAIPARNGVETYLAYRNAGSEHEVAASKAMGDAAWTYLMLALGDGTGAYAGAARTTGASQLVRAMAEGSGKSALRAAITGEAIKMAGSAAAQGGATYGHLKALQGAVGKAALDDEQVIASTVIAALTGAAITGISSIGEIRRAIVLDKTQAALRAQVQAQQRTGAPTNERGWLALERAPQPAGGQAGGLPAPTRGNGGGESALFRPVAVRNNGDVLLADGSLYRAQSQSWLLPGGAVADSEGNAQSVAPEANAYAAAAGEPLPETAGIPGEANGIPTVSTGLSPDDLNLYTMLSQGDSAVYNVPLEKLSVNDRIRQFKADADPKTGVVRGQELWGEYQAIPAKPILAMEFNDGHLEVVTGRHRLDLARRNNLQTIPANIIYERDGWTLEKAKLLDAMDNILDEKGTDADFVKFFASAGIDRATAQQKGLIARRKGKDAFDIAQLGSDDLAAAVINEDRYVTAPIAAAIAREAPKARGLFAEGVQRAVMRSVMDTRMDADGAAIMARSLIAQHQAAKVGQSAQQLDLFGADDTALAIGAEEAKYAAAKRREATKAIQRINAARTKSDALELKASWAKSLGITEASDPKQLDEVIAKLQATANAWANYYLNQELQQEANAHARLALGLSAHVAEQPDGTLEPIESPVQTTPEAEDDNQPALFDAPGEGKRAHKPQPVEAPIETEPSGNEDGATILGARGGEVNGQQAPIRGWSVVNSHHLQGQWQNLCGAPGTPRGNARMPLAMQDLVMLYHELSGGKLPHLRKSLVLGRALGVYHLDDPIAGKKRGTIELITRIFGLIENGDVEAITRQLIASGYFRHLNPTWSGNATPQDIQDETDRSNQALENEIETLARKRIENNFTNLESARVMAHELWHLIDDRDGGLNGRGNILGHIAAYKHYIKKSLPIAAITRKEIVDEANPLIAWWHGAAKMPDYYKKPEEMFAELGAIFFVAPEEMKQRAPKCYNAFAFAIEQHPQCKQAYDQMIAYIAAGSNGRLAQDKLAETWSREQQALYRKLTEQIYKPDKSARRNLMRLSAFFWDKRGPAMMLVNERFRDSIKQLKQNVKDAKTPVEKALAKDALKTAMDNWNIQRMNLRKNHLDYTRLGPSYAKLYLADVKGGLERTLSAIDNNPEIARRQLELYAHNKRVIELKGRATAWGIDAPAARKAIQTQMQDLGVSKFRAVVRAWNLFRATYEKYIVNDEDVRAMLAPETIDLMERNKHYVTMRHVTTAEQTQQLLDRLNNTPGSAVDIALENILPKTKTGDQNGISGYFKQLTGSLQATESPLLATAKTATNILMAAKRNRAILVLARELENVKHPEVSIVPWEQRTTTARTAPIEFFEGGKHLALQVPPVVAKGFESNSNALRFVTYATRVLNATLTTNNPGFVPFAYLRDLSSAAYNTPGLWRNALSTAIPPAGDLLALGAQFIPPRLMRTLSEVPLIGHLLFNQKSAEFWSAFARKIATIIHNGAFEQTLQQAQQARLEGKDAKANELIYLTQMARMALRDGVLLNMLQFRDLEYNASEWKALFSKYNLSWDDPDDQAPKTKLQKAVGFTTSLPGRIWNAFGDASEIEATTAKLVAYLYLHRDIAPGIEPQNAPSFANQDTRTAIATHTAYNTGDPTFELRGHLATFIECAFGPFWNARQKGFFRFYANTTDRYPLKLDKAGNPVTSSATANASEKFFKFAAKYGARYTYGTILTGAASAACVTLYRALTGNKDATRDDLEGTKLGTLADAFDWMRNTMQNVSPYILSKYNVIPIAREGDLSLVITTPMADEEILPNLIADANSGAVGAYFNPEASAKKVIEELANTILQPPGGQSHFFESLRIVQPWLFNSNPIDPYYQTPILTTEQFAARWTTRDAARVMASRAIKTSPLSILFRPRPENANTETPHSPLFKIHQALSRIPFLSTIEGRFIRIQVGGQTARAQILAKQDEENRLTFRLIAKKEAKRFREDPAYKPSLLLNKIPKEYTQCYVDAFNEAYFKNAPGADQIQREERYIKNVKSIRDPKLLKRALQ